VPNYKKELRQIRDYLKEQVEYPAVEGAPRMGAPTVAPQQLAQNAIADVLGWRPRATARGRVGQDPDAIRAVLTRSFAISEFEGHNVATWTPRSFSTQADIATVTGPQAILVARVRPSLNDMISLLDGLYPLLPAPDEQDVESIRAIVRDNLTELSTEWGNDDGPRVGRVDEILTSLLGPTRRAPNPEVPSGQLGILQKRFGLTRSQIATVEEEENFTNFVIFVDFVDSLGEVWNAQRQAFMRGAQALYFAPQIRDLSQELLVCGNLLVEFEAALESVYEVESRRQVRRFDVPGKGKLSVQDWIDWAHDFVFSEGPRLLQDVGRDGIVAFTSNVLSLRAALRALRRAGLPDPYTAARVKLVLVELAKTFNNLKRQADAALPNPIVHYADSTHAIRILGQKQPSQQMVRIDFWGENFRDDVTVNLAWFDANGNEIPQTAVRAAWIDRLDSTRLGAILDTKKVIAKRPPGASLGFVIENPSEGRLAKQF
jgi:hypothetical protein